MKLIRRIANQGSGTGSPGICSWLRPKPSGKQFIPNARTAKSANKVGYNRLHCLLNVHSAQFVTRSSNRMNWMANGNRLNVTSSPKQQW